MNHIRQSNFELLRIFSMMAVLYGHGVGLVLGLPFSSEFESNTFSSFFHVACNTLNTCGVNVFILISGWFGIHSSFKGLYKFLYQVFFLLLFIYIIFIVAGKTHLSFEGVLICCGITDGYWFIMAYLGLYLISPILNTFINHATKKQFQTILFSLYGFQCYYSWITGYVNYFEGYSIFLFIILYLTSRYARIYPIKIIEKNAVKYLIFIILIISLLVSFGLFFLSNALHMLRYDNPLIIFASLCILLSFNKIQINSKIINWLAASCFAVYIIHFNPFIFPYFNEVSHIIKNTYSGVIYVLTIILFFCIVYLLCVLIDQIRIMSWNLLVQKKLIK